MSTTVHDSTEFAAAGGAGLPGDLPPVPDGSVMLTVNIQRFNTDLLEAVELGFLIDLAEVLVVSALERKESRGGHFREDYATRDDVNFMRHTMAYREVDADGNETIRLDYKPVVQTRYKPMERKY